MALLDEDVRATGWSSCAITQNGVVRVMSQAAYPRSLSASVAARMLQSACRTEHHEFWACEPSLLDPGVVDTTRLHGPSQVTDAYLLALAVSRNGRLVTFDRSIALDVVPDASDAHLLVL